MIISLNIKISGQGLHHITPQIISSVASVEMMEGLCTLLIQHT